MMGTETQTEWPSSGGVPEVDPYKMMRGDGGEGGDEDLEDAVKRIKGELNARTVKKDSDDEDILLELNIEKTIPDKKQIFGWAYQTNDKDGNQIVDKSGEAIADIEELEKAAYKFVLTSRQQGDMHRRVAANPHVAGTMIESMVFTPEKIEKMGLPKGSLPTGWWVGFQVNDADWDDVKSGRRQFSIHGSGKKRDA